MSGMDASEVSELTNDLSAQAITEILDEANDHVKDVVFEGLQENTLEQILTIQTYTDDQLGRYINPETVNIKSDVSQETVQRYIRINGLLTEQTKEILVTNKDNKLVGCLSLVDLL